MPVAPPGFRSGFVALIGRPNVGKSTLLNGLVGQKVAITSPVAQTTRNRLQGIVTTASAQLIIVDTPGIHKPQHRLGEVLVQQAKAAMQSVDVIALVVDGSVPAGRGDQFIADWLPRSVPTLICRNKQDLLSHDLPLKARPGVDRSITDPVEIANSYAELCPNATQVGITALDEDSLPPFFDAVTALLPEGPYYYPPDLVTDQPERFIVGELIREQLLYYTQEEVPHSVAVIIDRIEELPNLTRILATILVERQSQKAIVIGKGGQLLKAIGTGARQNIQKLVLGKVYLELFVKVRPKWRQSPSMLAELGYRL